MDALTRTVARAIAASPCSLRALARTAGVSHVLLLGIRHGRRAATPAVALKVARALATWEARCQRAANRITRTLGDA